MASSRETGKEVSEPVAAKDGINEKDPATALGEWYVQYLSKRWPMMMILMSESWRRYSKHHLRCVSILSLTIIVHILYFVSLSLTMNEHKKKPCFTIRFFRCGRCRRDCVFRVSQAQEWFGYHDGNGSRGRFGGSRFWMEQGLPAPSRGLETSSATVRNRKGGRET
jgi:hypothetical protein